MKMASLDYETCSRADLPSVGAYRYACNTSTEILMCAVSDDSSEEVYLWVNPKFRGALPSEDRAQEILAVSQIYSAFNAPFEIAITWGNHCANPWLEKPPLEAWCCTAALARKAGLPSSLEKCALALGLEQQKDPRGKKLIKFFSEPREDGEFNDPNQFPEEFRAFGEYCKQDVRTEKAIHRKLKAFELTGLALETFQFDLRMNQRGIPVNVPALRNAQKIVEEVQSSVTAEFRELTGLNPTQRQKVLELLQSLGVKIDNMQGDTLEGLKTGDAKADRVIELYSKLSYAAVKKIQTMLDWVCPDGRMRGVLRYHGASTGRWSAGGPQIQNAKNPTPEMSGITGEAFAAIEAGWDAASLECVYGDALEVLASCVRHFVGEPGQETLDGDYNAIEGRIACWISGQDDILQDWRDDKDLYIRAAAFVENVPEDSIPKKSKLRNFGKVIELACQFGLGVQGFIRTCANFKIECDIVRAVRAVHHYYRPTHQKVVAYWYQLDAFTREAIATPGKKCGPCVVRTLAGMPYLLVELPSGRSLAFPTPEITPRKPTEEERLEMAEGKKFHPNRFLTITYFGQIPPSTRWGRVSLHGSLIFQNLVQAIAVDVMAYGAIQAEKQGMPIYALIHDQGLAERLNGKTAEDFSAALSSLPPWAKGLPLKVESKICKYYSK